MDSQSDGYRRAPSLLTSHRETEPYGLDGGEAGLRGENSVIYSDGTEKMLRGNDEIDLAAGDMIVIKTPGGGGFGVPEKSAGERIS